MDDEGRRAGDEFDRAVEAAGKSAQRWRDLADVTMIVVALYGVLCAYAWWAK